MRCAYRDGREHVGLSVASGKFHSFFPYSRKPVHTYAPCDSATAAAASTAAVVHNGCAAAGGSFRTRVNGVPGKGY